MKPLPRLVLVADVPSFGAAALTAALGRVLACVPGERVMVIDRDRPGAEGGTPDRVRLDRLCGWRALTGSSGAWLVVSGRADLASIAGAEGVQLPERGLPPEAVRRAFPELLVGRSCHDRAGLQEAALRGAAWALLSPIADPISKAATGAPLGVAGFARAVAGLRLPVYALGGITARLAPLLVAAGAAGIAAAGGVFGARDPGAAAAALARA